MWVFCMLKQIYKRLVCIFWQLLLFSRVFLFTQCNIVCVYSTRTYLVLERLVDLSLSVCQQEAVAVHDIECLVDGLVCVHMR